MKAFSTLTSEQKSVLSRTLDGFATCLVPSSTETARNPFTKEVISEKAWHNRVNWGEDEWNAWETWGWYRHFCAKVCHWFLRVSLLASLTFYIVFILSTNFFNNTWNGIVNKD
jgi:MIF4G like